MIKLTPEREKELLHLLAQGVVNFDDDAVKETVEACLAEGLDPHKAVFEGLIVGMQEVGRLYEQQEYFVPELLMCSDALYAGLDVFNPLMSSGKSSVRGKVLLGVVQGDVHDIGKNIVKIMLEAGGFQVYDLGRDVPSEKFVEELIRTDADVVAISAMMTTTMLQMKNIIREIKEKNPKARVIIGGAPVSEEIAALFGADGYGKDANHALKEVIRMVEG